MSELNNCANRLQRMRIRFERVETEEDYMQAAAFAANVIRDAVLHGAQCFGEASAKTLRQMDPHDTKLARFTFDMLLDLASERWPAQIGKLPLIDPTKTVFKKEGVVRILGTSQPWNHRIADAVELCELIAEKVMLPQPVWSVWMTKKEIAGILGYKDTKSIDTNYGHALDSISRERWRIDINAVIPKDRKKFTPA